MLWSKSLTWLQSPQKTSRSCVVQWVRLLSWNISEICSRSTSKKDSMSENYSRFVQDVFVGWVRLLYGPVCFVFCERRILWIDSTGSSLIRLLIGWSWDREKNTTTISLIPAGFKHSWNVSQYLGWFKNNQFHSVILKIIYVPYHLGSLNPARMVEPTNHIQFAQPLTSCDPKDWRPPSAETGGANAKQWYHFSGGLGLVVFWLLVFGSFSDTSCSLQGPHCRFSLG